MKKWQNNYADMVTVVRGDSGVPLPESLRATNEKSLRVVNGELVNAEEYTDFFIDKFGVKHVVQHDISWQAITCDFGDELVNDDSTWRKRTLADDTDNIKISKKQECYQYTESLIDEAYSNPTQSDVDVDFNLHKKLVVARQNNNANKSAGGLSLTIDETNQAKTDQKLSEHEVKCWETYIKSVTEIDKKTTAEDVAAIDVATVVVWPIWVAPI